MIYNILKVFWSLSASDFVIFCSPLFFWSVIWNIMYKYIYITLIFNLHLFQIPSPACFHGLFYREKDCKENGGTRKFGQRGKSKITFLDAFINQLKKPMLIEEEICQLILMLNSLSMTLHFSKLLYVFEKTLQNWCSYACISMTPK